MEDGIIDVIFISGGVYLLEEWVFVGKGVVSGGKFLVFFSDGVWEV